MDLKGQMVRLITINRVGSKRGERSLTTVPSVSVEASLVPSLVAIVLLSSGSVATLWLSLEPLFVSQPALLISG